ncbi:hypothetical protein COBT_001995, partial [Conglomerata obtusa]
MPGRSVKHAHEDIMKNFQKVTSDIINKRPGDIKKIHEKEVSDKEMQENLIYLLCGINTNNVQIDLEEKNTMIINSFYKEKGLIKAFEPICLYVKKAKRFINQIYFLEDFTKKIIRNYLVKRLMVYHETILKCMKLDIEIIYTKLSMFFDEFKEFNNLIDEISVLSEFEVYNFLYAQKFNMRKSYFDLIIEEIEKITLEMTYKWIEYGESTDNFYIRENNCVYEFDECYWRNKYKIIDTYPIFLKKHLNKIYTAGLVINVLHTDYLKENTYTNIEYQLSNNFYENINFFYENNLNYFTGIIKPILTKEINYCHEKYFLKNTAEICDILEKLGTKIFLSLNDTIAQINSFQTTQYKISDTRINHFILKILNVEKNILNVRINVIENLCLERNKNILDLFFSQKIFFELEIIYRFFYQLFIFNYILIRYEKNTFTSIAILFIAQLRSSLYYNVIDSFNENVDIEDFISEFEKYIKICLKEFYLTNAKVYQIYSEIFDLFYDYIYVKDNNELYLNRFLDYINLLFIEMQT